MSQKCIALVTGASSGLGKAFVKLLLKEEALRKSGPSPVIRSV